MSWPGSGHENMLCDVPVVIVVVRVVCRRRRVSRRKRVVALACLFLLLPRIPKVGVVGSWRRQQEQAREMQLLWA